MILGIDASNIRQGGGVTHLVELLRAADPTAHGFSRVILWGGSATLVRIEDRPWLVKAYDPVFDGALLRRAFWQRYGLSKLARSEACDVLFAPGGTFVGEFRPVVSMSRNLLPFEWQELRRFGCSWLAAKQALLRITQGRTFQRVDGLIFLTRYARDVILRAVPVTGSTTIIPHGIGTQFTRAPRAQLPIGEYSPAHPYRILYVSTIDVYKHQHRVAEAVSQLRAQGLPVVLELAGPAYPPALRRLRLTLERLDRPGEFLRYRGAVPYTQLPDLYAQADAGVFASSCENMPNILLEGMAAGLPMACSSRGPMPEMLADAGVYFDPEDANDIASALRQLIESPDLRARLAGAAFERVRAYSWQRCAAATLGFLARVAGAPRTGAGAPPGKADLRT